MTAEQVYREHYPRMYRVALSILRRPYDAEDAVSRAMISVVRHLPSFRGDSAITTWLHRIVVNEALSDRDNRKDRRIRQLKGNNIPARTETEPDCGRDDAVHAVRRVNEALDCLPTKYAVALADLMAGRSNEETAASLGVTVAAVKNWRHRGKAMMREILGAGVDE